MQLRNVLLVDDDPNIRRITEICLSRMGDWNVTVAASGSAAMEILKDFVPDLIVSDVMMGTMDGPTLYKLIRQDPKLERVPVVFMTAKAQLDEIESLYRSGVSGVITKPFDPMTLCDDVDKFLAFDTRTSRQVSVA